MYQGLQVKFLIFEIAITSKHMIKSSEKAKVFHYMFKMYQPNESPAHNVRSNPLTFPLQ